MQRNSNPMCTLVGALVLSAGIASPLALASDPDQPDEQKTQAQQSEQKSTEAADGVGESAADTERPDGDMVKVRISLPDGRVIVRMEPRAKRSARYSQATSSPESTSRRLSDGSRISFASRGVSGGSNSSSIRSGGSSGGGGGGGGGASSGGSGGGGGGGASSGAKDAQTGTKGVLSFSNNSKGEQSIDNNEESEAALIETTEEVTTQEAETTSRGGGVFSYGAVSTNTGSSSASSSTSSSQSQAGTQGGSQAGNQTEDADVTTSTPQTSTPSVPTIGDPILDDDGDATGGQSIKFTDLGMAATVIGNRVYLKGAEIVTSNKPFTVVTGTRVAVDSVILDPTRQQFGDSLDSITSSSEIVLEFASGTVVDLMMFTQSANMNQPNRTQRTWTVRIR